MSNALNVSYGSFIYKKGTSVNLILIVEGSEIDFLLLQMNWWQKSIQFSGISMLIINFKNKKFIF